MTTIRQLSAIKVDYDDPQQVTGQAIQLCRLASEAGLFHPGRGNAPEAAAIRQSAKEWLRQIDHRLDSMTAADALQAIGSYDIIHRLAWQTPAYPDVINRQVLRAFDAPVHGDRRIDRYALFRQITAGLNRRDPAYLGRLLQWQSLCLDRWHKEFRRQLAATARPAAARAASTASRFAAASTDRSLTVASAPAEAKAAEYDRIQQATLLLESDLWVFETGNESTFKRQIFNAVRQHLDRPDGHDTRTLRALDALLTAALRLGYLTPEVADALRAAIAAQLLAHPSANPLHRPTSPSTAPRVSAS